MLKSMTNTNLLSSWTKGKITKLLLLSGLTNLANAGQALANCYDNGGFEGDFEFVGSYVYSSLLNYDLTDNFAINNGQTIELCCEVDYCFASIGICGTPLISYAFCTRIG